MDIETIPAGKFKAHCLRLISEVQQDGHSLVVTKRGKPMVKIVPVKNERKKKKKLFGCMKGSVRIMGDIVSPLPEEWTTPSPWPFPE